MLASCQLTGDHCDAHFFPSSHNVTNQALIMSPPHSLFFHKRAICDTFTSTTRNFPSIVFHLEYLRAAGRVESNYQKESKMSCLCSQQSHALLRCQRCQLSIYPSIREGAQPLGGTIYRSALLLFTFGATGGLLDSCSLSTEPALT